MTAPRLPRVSRLHAAALGLALLAGCGEENTTPPFEWPDGGYDAGPGRDGGTDAGDDGGTLEVSCEVGDVITVGIPEIKDLQTNPDRVSIVADPAGSGFLLATAELHCPPPCSGEDGGFEDNWERRRVMLYPIAAGVDGAPGTPVMVGEGIGPLQKTDAEHPVLALVGDSLVAAWIDNVETEKRNVWARSLSLPSFAPRGAMTRVSAYETGRVRKLVAATGSAGAEVIFEHLVDDAPTLHGAAIAADGTPGAIVDHGGIPAGADAHAAVGLESGEVLFGRTDPTSGGHCDYLLGLPGGDLATVQQDPSTFACGDVALARGGTAFAATSGGRGVVQFRPLAADGTPIGSERRVAGDIGTPAYLPGIAPVAGGFLVVYVQAGTQSSLRAALLAGGGAVVDDFELAPSIGSISNPSLATAVDGADIAVAWKERVGAELETRLLRLHCE